MTHSKIHALADQFRPRQFDRMEAVGESAPGEIAETVKQVSFANRWKSSQTYQRKKCQSVKGRNNER